MNTTLTAEDITAQSTRPELESLYSLSRTQCDILKKMNLSQAETIDSLRQEVRDLKEINVCLCNGNIDRLKDELDEMLAEAKADVLTVLAEIEAARVKIRCPEKCIDVEEDGHG